LGKKRRKGATAEKKAETAADKPAQDAAPKPAAPNGYVAAGMCIMAGCLLFLSCADFDIWPLTWVALVPTLWAVMTAPTDKRAFLYGFLTGVAANAGGFYWIVGLLQRFAFLPLPAALPIFLLLCAYQALVFGFFAWFVRVMQRRTRWPFVLCAPIVMVALELVTPFIFPWYLAITQAWVLPVIQLAELTGPLGITFCLCMVNGALYDLLDARLHKRPLPRRPAIAAAAVMALVLGFGFLRIYQIDQRWAAAPKLRVGLVQPNIRFDLKPQVTQDGQLDYEHYRRLQVENNVKHQESSILLEKQGAQLIVWPESSYPYRLPRDPLPMQNPDRNLRVGWSTPLLFGAITEDDQHEYPFNTALMLSADNVITGRYDKIFLLMFGEYIPLAKTFPVIKKWLPSTAGMFERGASTTTFELADPRAPGGKWRLGPLICYEDILPRFGTAVARKHPHVFVNITNDAWFGDTSEPWEHLALAVYRSTEHRTGMVRAVQTGVSGFIDATGRVRKHVRAIDPPKGVYTPPDVLIDDVAMLEAGHTFYAGPGSLWGLLDLVGLICLGILLWPLSLGTRDWWLARRARKKR